MNLFDSSSYSAFLLAKLAKLQELVATNSTAAAHKQKNQYDKNCVTWTLFSWGTSMALSAYSQ